MSIYKRIKDRRLLLGISQQDLADISGVGLRTIKLIETNNANPAISTFVKLIDVLGLELDLRIKQITKE